MPSFLSFSIVFSALFLLSTGGAIAQEMKPDSVQSAWAFGGTGNLNFSQVSVNNWAAGGQNSLSVLGMINLVANYKRGKNTWNNTLGITLGAVKLERQRVRKSDDRLEINIKYGRETGSEKWFYTGQFNLRSQLMPTLNEARDARVSNFLSPGFFLVSAGMDYKPSPRLSVFMSPVTGKFTVVLSQELADMGAFGVNPAWRNEVGTLMPGTGQRFRKELGGFVNIRYTQKLVENVTLRSKLDFFSNYLDSPENIDVNWESILDLKVNKFLSANLFFHLIYDDDIMIREDTTGDGVFDSRGPRLQIRETLGIGLSYKLN